MRRRFPAAALRRLLTAALLILCIAPVRSSAEEPDRSYLAPLASASLLLDADRAGQQLIAVGERGHVLHSADGGATWSQAEVPTRRLLSAVAVLDTLEAWAVGHDAVILHTADGGLTWTVQHQDPELESPLFDLWFTDGRRGLVIGAYGLCLETIDGGQTWRSRQLGEGDPHYYSLSEGPRGDLYVAGEFGTLLRSDDRGRTWQTLPSPYQGSFFKILALTDGSVLVCGLRGHLYRSEDRGESWQPVATGTSAALMGGLQRADGSIVLVGLSGARLTSVDGGRTFRLDQRPDRIALSGALELPGGDLLLLGEDGFLREETP